MEGALRMEGGDLSGGERWPGMDGDSCRGWRRQPDSGGRSWVFGGAPPATASVPSGLAAGNGCGSPVPSVSTRERLAAAERAGAALRSGQSPLPSPGTGAVYI